MKTAADGKASACLCGPGQLTRDLVPVVSASPALTVGDLMLPVHLLTLAQLRSLDRDDARST